MKVTTNYSDGHYWLTEYEPGHAAVGIEFVEISDDEWSKYREWLKTANEWHNRLRDLSNEQYYKQHPEDRKTFEEQDNENRSSRA